MDMVRQNELLPHSVHLEISALLKFLQISACKMDHEVVLLSYNTQHGLGNMQHGLGKFEMLL